MATYPKGLYFNKSKQDWKKGEIKIKRDECIEWLKTQPEEIRIDCKESQSGDYYAAINDWKPQKESNGANLNHEPPLSFEDMRDEAPF